MKWVLIIAGIIILLVLAVVVIGYLLPVKHSATVKQLVPATREMVWERITNYSKYPEWRKDLKCVQAGEQGAWIEENKDGEKLPLKIENAEINKLFIIRIDGKNLPYGGTWEFNLSDSASGTMVSITENGEVYNPIFRFVSRFIIGHDGSPKKYAAFLEQSFK